MDARRIRDIYKDFVAGRLDRLADALDEEIDFISYAPTELFPYLGRRHGRSAVLEAWTNVHSKLRILSFWPITTIIDGNEAALTVQIHIKDRATGRPSTFLAAHFLKFRDGRIVTFRAVVDSLAATRQSAGEGAFQDQSQPLERNVVAPPVIDSIEEMLNSGLHVDAAMQYLTWSLEEIDKSGQSEAASHVQNALKELRAVRRGETKQTASKPDK